MKSLPSHLLFLTCGLMATMPAVAETPQPETITQAQWLTNQRKPAFKPGHTMPRLTRYAYALPVDAAIKFCEDWGYALEFPYPLAVNPENTYNLIYRLNDPNSPQSIIAALAKSDPVRYPLQAEITKHVSPEDQAPPGSFAQNASGQTLYSGVAHQTDGTTIPAGPVWSLDAPLATWELFAKYRADGIRELNNRGIPLAYVLNGGEYGLGFWENSKDYWYQDPRFSAGIAASVYGPGDKFTFEHCSAMGEVSEHIIADAVKAAAPQRSLYINYTAGGRTERNRFFGMPNYGGFWEHSRGQGDLPNNESYFKSNGNGFTEATGDGRRDILTQALNAKALEIQTGNPLSYNWISAGWDGNEADEARWTGFLKCYYTSGMIGSNVGAYGSSKWQEIGHPTFPTSGQVPIHLRHMVISSHVHALFTHVEDLLRNGDLLPGPAQHEMSPDVPAYEFPTGEGVNSRVLARKHRTQNTWLITAWAADGPDRKVSVYIPELGNLTLEARAVGSVYKATLANGKVTLMRIDNEGATYTAVANGKPVVTPVNLTIPEPTDANRLLWLSADSGVTADAAGKVLSWAGQGSGAIKVIQADAAKRPTLVANAMNGKPALRFENAKTWLEGTIKSGNFDGGLMAFVVFTPASMTNKCTLSLKNTDEFFTLNDNVTDFDSVVSNGIARKVASRETLKAPMSAVIVGDTNQYGPGGQNGLTGDIAEVLVYKNITQLTAAAVKMYLDDKYNLKGSVGILANGSFELPVVTGLRYTPNQAAGWFFANKAAIQANGSVFKAAAAPEGIQTAVLQGSSNQLGSMSQTLTLDAGTYHLTFKVARQSDDVVQPLKFSVGQTQIGSLITPTSTAFVTYTTSAFTVTAGKHTLRFDATDGAGDKSTFIDQIELVKTTAPATAR